jgi:protein-S-isoprenylcysteine O-methyltransferase Ste14
LQTSSLFVEHRQIPQRRGAVWALVFRSGVGVALTLLIIPPLIARIRAEEALLRTQFAGEYDAYWARTWRLLPGIY